MQQEDGSNADGVDGDAWFTDLVIGSVELGIAAVLHSLLTNVL